MFKAFVYVKRLGVTGTKRAECCGRKHREAEIAARCGAAAMRRFAGARSRIVYSSLHMQVATQQGDGWVWHP